MAVRIVDGERRSSRPPPKARLDPRAPLLGTRIDALYVSALHVYDDPSPEARTHPLLVVATPPTPPPGNLPERDHGLSPTDAPLEEGPVVPLHFPRVANPRER